MKNWQETTQVFERLIDIVASGEQAALATVIAIEGSAYRRPGAKLLIEPRGLMLGGVSGGCLESDVREVAREVLADKVPVTKTYDTSDSDVPWGLGLGCRGTEPGDCRR